MSSLRTQGSQTGHQQIWEGPTYHMFAQKWLKWCVAFFVAEWTVFMIFINVHSDITFRCRLRLQLFDLLFKCLADGIQLMELDQEPSIIPSLYPSILPTLWNNDLMMGIYYINDGITYPSILPSYGTVFSALLLWDALGTILILRLPRLLKCRLAL